MLSTSHFSRGNMAVSWLNYPVLKQHESGNTFYADVINHYAKRERFDSKLTEAHEVSHFIHADIRNAQGGRVNAFYVGNNQAAVVKEPAIRKRIVAGYIPRSLQGFRYKTYVTGQTEWDDRALYLWDEWSAYVNGGETGVDFVEKNLYKEQWTDGVYGLLEFTVYGSAVAMATKDLDTATFNDPQFLGFLEFQALRSERIYLRGSIMKQFKFDQQDNFLKNLRTSSDASALRDFLKTYCQGAFLDRPTPTPTPTDTVTKKDFDVVGD